MFFWCCAEEGARSSRKVSSAETNIEPDLGTARIAGPSGLWASSSIDVSQDYKDAGADAEEESFSRVSVTQFPALPDPAVNEEFLPKSIPTKSVTLEETAGASPSTIEESTIEGNSSPPEGMAKQASCTSGVSRRSRLQIQAADSHWKLQSSDIRIEKELSRTLKSTLHLATWKGTQVVMKCVQVPDEGPVRKASSISSKRSKESVTASRPMQMHDVNEELLEELLHEIELLSSLRHPDLVLFLGACLDKDSPVMCVTEYMPGGDLERYYMAKRRQNQTDCWRPPLTQIVDWCLAVGRALSFLHTRGAEPIVHRDLKPLNLLLTKHLEVKVADLGISKMMAAVATDVYNMTGGVGSWLYMAPECVRHQTYNEKVDIYAFSLIMFFMSAGKAPFYQMGKDPELVLKEYLKGNEPRPTENECHAPLRSIMKSAWAVNHKERPSAQSLVERLKEVREEGVPPMSCFCLKA
eukprot:s951_g2.t1